MKGAIVALLLLLASCGSVRWVEDLRSQLCCGMSLSDVREFTGREVERIEPSNNTLPWRGSYRVDGKYADVWLDFEDDRLVSVISGRIDGLTSVRLSPKANLCTGELTFQLYVLILTEKLLGTVVYLDGQQVAVMDEIRQDIEVSAGVHELRIELEGFLPYVMELERGPDDPGAQRLEIRVEDTQILAKMAPG